MSACITRVFYEGRAVIGHIAGKMTETNKVGYIASFPIPEVIMGINAAYLAAKAVNPDVEFSIIWAYTWYDPAQEAAAAEALIETRRRHYHAAHRFDRAAHGCPGRRDGFWPSPPTCLLCAGFASDRQSSMSGRPITLTGSRR